MTAEKFDVYSHVTNQIIAQIEAGTPPWRKPWTGGGASVSLPERFNGEAYRGINILMLWATAMAKDYSSARWMTFNQAKQLGGHVRKGEKSATVVKYGTVEREDENGEERQIPYAKAYRVFNADQIEACPLNSTSCRIRPVILAPWPTPSWRRSLPRPGRRST